MVEGRSARDLLVVGAGPCGLAVGVAAREAGLRCTLVDKGPVVSAIERYPLRMRFFSTAEKLEIGGVPFVIDGDKPTRSEALAYYRAVARRHELSIRQYETVTAARRRDDGFEVETRSHVGREGRYLAANLVIATGKLDHYNPLDVRGESTPKVTHYFREPHLYFDQDVVVVGGGNSAVEAALAVWRAGGRVTLVHLFDRLDDGVKPWILPDIENRIEEGEIAALWAHRIEAIEPEVVRVRDLEAGTVRVLENDWVLAMTGYLPDTRLLEALGVEILAGSVPRFDPETYETNVPGVFVAGVLVAGDAPGQVFIENGRHHGPAIVASLETRAR